MAAHLVYVIILLIYVRLAYLFCLLESKNAPLVNSLAALCKVIGYKFSNSSQQKEKLNGGTKQLELATCSCVQSACKQGNIEFKPLSNMPDLDLALSIKKCIQHLLTSLSRLACEFGCLPIYQSNSYAIEGLNPKKGFI